MRVEMIAFLGVITYITDIFLVTLATLIHHLQSLLPLKTIQFRTKPDMNFLLDHIYTVQPIFHTLHKTRATFVWLGQYPSIHGKQGMAITYH